MFTNTFTRLSLGLVLIIGGCVSPQKNWEWDDDILAELKASPARLSPIERDHKQAQDLLTELEDAMEDLESAYKLRGTIEQDHKQTQELLAELKAANADLESSHTLRIAVEQDHKKAQALLKELEFAKTKLEKTGRLPSTIEQDHEKAQMLLTELQAAKAKLETSERLQDAIEGEYKKAQMLLTELQAAKAELENSRSLRTAIQKDHKKAQGLLTELQSAKDILESSGRLPTVIEQDHRKAQMLLAELETAKAEWETSRTLRRAIQVDHKKAQKLLAELETAKADLNKDQIRNTLRQHQRTIVQLNKKVATHLEQQKTIIELNYKVSTQLSRLANDVQRIKEVRDNPQAPEKVRGNEQTNLTPEEKTLDQRMQEARTTLDSRKNDPQMSTSNNRASKNDMPPYQKKFPKSTGPATSLVPKADDRDPLSALALNSKTSIKETPPPSGVQVAMTVPKNPSLSLVNINTSSVNDLILFLGLRKGTAEMIMANRPYRIRGELVAKKVLSRETFQAIRDRITAAQ